MAIILVNQILLAAPGIYDNTIGGTANGAGESMALVGYIRLQGGAGSKTFSSAGGKVWWQTGAVTFADAGTNVRVGVQDVAAGTGLEDGTFDVYADLAGGGGGIPNIAFAKTTMTNGSKTISDGDLIAIVVEMTARGGADSVQFSNAIALDPGELVAYGTIDGGAGLGRTTDMPVMMLEFDDGTFGWLYRNMPLIHSAWSTFAVQVGSTPDEYLAAFTPVIGTRISEIGVYLGAIIDTDTFELNLFSDPLGSPSLIQSVTANPFVRKGNTNGPMIYSVPVTPVTLAAGTTYGVSFRPTSAGTINWYYYDFTSGFDGWKVAGYFGASLKMAARTNQTGAFVETQAYHAPGLVLRITGYDNAGGGSGGGGSFSWVG